MTTKSKVLYCRVTPAEHTRVKQAAERLKLDGVSLGGSIATLVYVAVMRYLDTIEKENEQ